MKGIRYLCVARIKQKAKEKNRRVGSDFLMTLDVFIEKKIDQACGVHNGSKKTLDSAVAGFIGLRK